jgi:beta-exotoxin I transport system permease protein
MAGRSAALGGSDVNRVLFARTVASLRVRVLLCGLGLLGWGAVLPVVYAAFGKDLQSFMLGNPTLSQFTQFAGGDIFTLTGAIALGFIHPITILLMGIVAVGFPATAIAGERQRGTLEVLLARPVSRRVLLLTLFVVGGAFLAVLMALEVIGSVISAELVGVGSELVVANTAPLWLNGWLMFMAFMAIGFAASVSFDRLAPALGLTLAVVLVSYFLDVLGTLWPDAAWLEGWSLFSLLDAKHVLEKGFVPGDALALALVTLGGLGLAWVAFPRRDLGAPA